MTDLLCRSFCLPDGRILTYAEYGAPNGDPVFYFHGTPGSRLEPALLGNDKFEKANIRLIACDRPGMGGSDFQPGRGFSHWAADVVALADHLGLGKFGIFGVSGGSGYVAACACLIPDRLTSAVIVSGAGRMDSPEARANLSAQGRLIWWIATRSVRLMELMLSIMRNGTKVDPAKIRRQGMKGMQPVEAAVFEKPGRLEAFMATGAESMRQGTRGVAWDTHLYPRPWDFRLEEIQFPIRLLHGEADLNIPVAVARKLAADIPNCQAIFYPGEGHISTVVNHLDEVIFALVSKR